MAKDKELRALIFGADGYLGANLARYLLDRGHEVIGAALNRKGETSLDALDVSLRLEYGDVTDYAFVERLVNAYEPTHVFHLAAVSIVKIADANPARAFRTNILGTLNVADACKRADVRCIVASSDKAYGDNNGKPYFEETPFNPTGAYEISKASADMVARHYGAIVTRCANLYGPGDLNFSRLVPNACRHALKGEPPVVNRGAWNYKREWLYVKDACKAYITVAQKGCPGRAYNVGSGVVRSAGQVASYIAHIAGVPEPTEASRVQTCYEIPTQVMNSDRIHGLEWEHTTDLGDGLRKTLDWYAEYLV